MEAGRAGASAFPPLTAKLVADMNLSLGDHIPKWEQVSGPDDCRYLPLSFK